MTSDHQFRIAVACRTFEVLGGRERDCLEISARLAELGHQVTILTNRTPAQGWSPPEGWSPTWQILPERGWTNHGRVLQFSRAVNAWRTSHEVDAILGFNCIAGLDFLYMTDQPRPRQPWPMALLPRYRTVMQLEQAAFGAGSRTTIFFLAAPQAANFARRYGLDPSRYTVLPPVIGQDRAIPREFYASRRDVRAELGVPDNHRLLVNISIYGQQKGVDRAIEALSCLPGASLVVAGLKERARYEALARRHGVAERVRFVGYTPDPYRLIGAADLMVHPARVETTGSVIVESLACGVPVVSTASCGYSVHVEQSRAGRVLGEPFRHDEFVRAIDACLAPGELEAVRQNARGYAQIVRAWQGTTGNAAIISERMALSRIRAGVPGARNAGSPTGATNPITSPQ